MYIPYFKIEAVSSFPIVRYRIEKPNGEPFENTDWQESPVFVNAIPIPTGTQYIVLKAEDEEGCVASYEFYTGPFYMRAIGGRTQGTGIVASWYSSQPAESRIRWAITEDFTPPPIEEFEFTEWNNNFTNYHEVLFPEVRFNSYHWFYAFSRSKYGTVISSNRRGLYVVPSEFYIGDDDFINEPSVNVFNINGIIEQESNRIRFQRKINEKRGIIDNNYTHFLFEYFEHDGTLVVENSQIRTGITIQL